MATLYKDSRERGDNRSDGIHGECTTPTKPVVVVGGEVFSSIAAFKFPLYDPPCRKEASRKGQQGQCQCEIHLILRA